MIISLKVFDQYICFWLRYVNFRVNGQLVQGPARREREKSTCMRIEWDPSHGAWSEGSRYWSYIGNGLSNQYDSMNQQPPFA